MEELLAQLLQQRSLQTKMESDAKHGPLLQQLRQRKVEMNGVTRLHPQDNMPVIIDSGPARLSEDGRNMQTNDIAALRERGLDIPAYMYNGMYPENIADAHRSGAEMDGYRRDLGVEPGRKGQFPGFQEAKSQDMLYRGGDVEDRNGDFTGGETSPELNFEKRQKVGRLVDQDVQDSGGHFNPGLLDGLSEQEAARRIADQLQAQRERNGDPTAWWNVATSTY